jgi:predicted nucleic acid-binding protein
MRVFVDTSALYALCDADDSNHPAATGWLSKEARDARVVLVTHNYVCVESAALVHRRLGKEAVRYLLSTLLPIASPFYVDESLHKAASAAYLASERNVSLVDHVSFALMRHLAVESAFAFDNDFIDQGFAVLPS